MSRRRLLAWGIVYTSAVLAVVGFLVFVIGLVVEFVDTRRMPLEGDEFSPVIQIALGGLCLSGFTVLLGFILVGLLLARQSRKQAPGYGDAYRFIESLQFSQAIPLLERAVRDGRETADVLMMLTTAYAFNGQLAKAQAIADRAVQLYPDDPASYLTLANGYRMQASYEESARALQTATELAPDQPIMWAELGFVQQSAGNKDAALKAFQHAAEQPMPPMYSVRVYYHLAQAYAAAHQVEKAVESTAKMMSARHGLDAWLPMQQAMEGTVYGQSLHYEIENIASAIEAADAASLK
ncbi:tetratricopeptide repeat protein [Phototrophicus methaneseepsis]|uniref:Tetratricopeptide repeat protein n=1 Tax=Phototrophicus methaneseepsis TaxID=2710758 RepID=A0A7S8E5H7_9CHLR|nr:tetratricopeptide repeat protein [Phototrophicus methaneseepsis]QPC80726.1 tetratricopeptide repeat protein [Phototrophicus methaneseepsis]